MERKRWVLRGGYCISSYPTTTTGWLGSQFDTQLTNGSFSYNPNNATLSPDGIGSYMLRSRQQNVAGGNTPSSLINVNETRLLTRGSFNGIRISPDLSITWPIRSLKPARWWIRPTTSRVSFPPIMKTSTGS